MKKFNATFMRQFEVAVEADDIKTAEKLALVIVNQFPVNTCTLLSVIADDYVEPPEAPTPIRPSPRGKPTGGGSPGTPIVSEGAPLVDQIAEAA